MSEERTCWTCRFVDRSDRSDLKCRRHAPTVNFQRGWHDPVPGDQKYLVEAVAIWPGVETTDWCGEWMVDARPESEEVSS